LGAARTLVTKRLEQLAVVEPRQYKRVMTAWSDARGLKPVAELAI
jgi:hypothetical protein